jgi:hypothetical protein
MFRIHTQTVFCAILNGSYAVRVVEMVRDGEANVVCQDVSIQALAIHEHRGAPTRT